MAWTESFYCDVCGKAKGDATDWWMAWTECYTSHDGAAPKQQMKLMAWETMLSHSADVKHLCGARCMQTLMDRWMTEQLEEDPQNPHCAS